MQSKDCERFHQASSVLSTDLHKLIITLDPKIKEKATEIRLRINNPLTVCCGKDNYYITSQGNTLKNHRGEGLLYINAKHMSETFQRLCGFSVYSYQKELRQGYLTIRGGHRAGICATAVTNDDDIVGIREVTSVNIRISREITDSAAGLYARIGSKLDGTIIVGTPASGKTTVLRDFARRISLSGKNVTVIDERGEISGTWNGNIVNDLGMCDVLNGYPKAKGIITALRSMSPDVIVCDEIGTLEDCKAVEAAVNTGVVIVASIHAQSLEGLSQQLRGKALIKTGAFKYAVMLSGKDTPGKIEGIYDIQKENSDAQDNRNTADNISRSTSRGTYGSQADKKNNFL